MKKPFKWLKDQNNGQRWGMTPNGAMFVIDANDVEKIGVKGVYITTHGYFSVWDKGKNVSLHRYLTAPGRNENIDHINMKKWDNRRDNLRVATKAQNGFNREAPSQNKSGVKGVSWDKFTGKWVGRLVANKKVMLHKRYDTFGEAVAAYSDASAKYHGDFGRTTA